jgi:hypothetical protein
LLADPGGYAGDWSGVLWSKTDNGVTTVRASTDADSAPKMQITLTGTYQVMANDIISEALVGPAR